MAEMETTEAKTRDQVVEYGNLLKFQLALGMSLQTPAICIACQKSGAIPNTCTAGENMDEVGNKFERHSEYNEPLVNICKSFVSYKKAVKPVGK